MTDRHLDKTTSSGMKMSDVPEFARKNVIWFDGMDGPAKGFVTLNNLSVKMRISQTRYCLI